MKKIKGRLETALVLCAVLAASAVTCMGQVQGTIYKKDGGKAVPGNIRYIPSRRIYEVVARTGVGQGNVTIQIPEREVSRFEILKPAGFDKAEKMVSMNQHGQAIPILLPIVREYANLQWDGPALGLLGECYMKTGRIQEAIDTIDKAIKSGSQGLSAQLFNLYLDALLQKKDFVRLEKAIDSIIESGAREAAAAVQIKRGDMLKEKGKVREALVDGYLRTVLLFQEVKEVRAEAVYKALKAFEDLGQMSYAEKMRKILLVDFPNDPYTARAKTGT